MATAIRLEAAQRYPHRLAGIHDSVTVADGSADQNVFSSGQKEQTTCQSHLCPHHELEHNTASTLDSQTQAVFYFPVQSVHRGAAASLSVQARWSLWR